MNLFDTHAHLDDKQFDACRDPVIVRAQKAGVAKILSVGTTASSSEKTVHIAEEHDSVFAAVGLQPNHCGQTSEGDWDRIESLAQHPRVVALGETGLDRYWDYTPFEIQQDYFSRHLVLSQQTDLPFVVHMRDCQEDVLQMLREARRRGPLRGVMHSFTGNASGAAECIELGLHISFAGMVTFKRSDELRDVARRIPDERILIETDAPYLTPEPQRSVRPNEPSFMVHTARCLADVREVSLDHFAAQTTANAQRLFLDKT